jgi:hypothetical protein
MHDDEYLQKRLVACASEQNKGDAGDGAEQASNWVNIHKWAIVNAPGWAAKWDSARVNGNIAPGNDASVITDEDMLAVIQPMT